MKKAERTAKHIQKYVDFFTKWVGDAPTQKEVAENTAIPYRTVQRYFAAGTAHQYNQIGGNRLGADSEAAEEFSDLISKFWREVDDAPKVKETEHRADFDLWRKNCERFGFKENNRYTLERWIKRNINRPTKHTFQIAARQFQKGIEGNTYYWEHVLQLYEERVLIEEVPTSKEFFDSLSNNSKLWRYSVTSRRNPNIDEIWNNTAIHLEYLVPSKVAKITERKKIERLVEIEKVLEANDSPFLTDISLDESPFIQRNDKNTEGVIEDEMPILLWGIL